MVRTTSELTLAPVLLLLQELLVLLLLPRASVMMTELPAHTAAAHSCELKKATPRSMVSKIALKMQAVTARAMLRLQEPFARLQVLIHESVRALRLSRSIEQPPGDNSYFTTGTKTIYHGLI